MKPSELKLRPEEELPRMKLVQLLDYPELQRRINNQQFDVSGIHNLIVQLKTTTIQQLKEEFINNNNNVNLHQFIWLVSNSLNVKIKGAGGTEPTIEEQYYQYELQYELVKVFEDIDIDNSNEISWEEYIEYITCSSLTEYNNQSNEDSDVSPGLDSEFKKAKQLSYSHQEKTVFRKNPIRKLVQLEKQGLLAILEKKSDHLSFISIDGSVPAKNFELFGVDCNKVLSLDYSENERMFGVLLSNHRVVFVEDGEMQKNNGENKFSGDEIEIVYLKKHLLWMLVSLDHSIQIFKPPKGRTQNQHQTSQQTLLLFKPHQNSLINIRELHNPLSLCTASLNGELRIWSLALNQLLIEIHPCKQEDFIRCKSIKGFEVFNKNAVSYIICWMFSNQISVWLPSSSLSKPYIGKLKGHIGIVEQAQFLTNFPIAVSIDNKNSVRVWDITRLTCLQTWRIETNVNIKIHILRSIPMALIYEKLIDYYKITREEDYNNLITKVKITQTKISLLSDIEKKRQSFRNSIMPETIDFLQNIESIAENKSAKKLKFPEKYRKVTFQNNSEKNDDEASISSESASEASKARKVSNKFLEDGEEEEEIPNTMVSVLYDDFFDCLIILLRQEAKLVAINTGKILNSIQTTSSNQYFVTMCLKEHRRLFIGNNLGQIGMYRLEDCARLYKFTPFADLPEEFIKTSKDSKNCSSKLMLKTDQLEVRKKNMDIMENKVNTKSEVLLSESQANSFFEIFALDFNTYNKVLVIIGAGISESIMITYDSFLSVYEPVKKKEVVFEQGKLCAFSSAQKYNLFYIGSNQPDLISVWDYHNFIILKTIEFPFFIRSLQSETHQFCTLIVTSTNEITVLKIDPIDARNNTRQANLHLIKDHFILRAEQKLSSCCFITIKSESAALKTKQIKVSFDDQAKEQRERKNSEKNMNESKYGIYVVSGSTIHLIKINSFLDLSDTTSESNHCETANITKEFKRATMNYKKLKDSVLMGFQKNTLNFSDLIIETITNLKNKVKKIGCVRDLLYFSTQAEVLNFYQPSDSLLCAKLSLPNCEIIEWQICFILVDKILNRMKKAEKASREIYACKRSTEIDKNKEEYLRFAFILNKYFKPNEMQNLRRYIKLNKQKLLEKSKKLLRDDSLELLKVRVDKGEKIINQMNNRDATKFFEQKFEERTRTKTQANEKMKEIEKKYNRVFSYIKNKNEANETTQNMKNSQKNGTGTKFASSHTKTLSSMNLGKNRSTSQFKIRNTVSSVNKMYFEHSKEIRQCLKKIGILNNKTSNLKL